MKGGGEKEKEMEQRKERGWEGCTHKKDGQELIPLGACVEELPKEG